MNKIIIVNRRNRKQSYENERIKFQFQIETNKENNINNKILFIPQNKKQK